jgi:hypothetical protein
MLNEALRVGNVVTNYQFLSQTGKELVNQRVSRHEVPAIGIHRTDLQALLWQKLQRVSGVVRVGMHQDYCCWASAFGTLGSLDSASCAKG